MRRQTEEGASEDHIAKYKKGLQQEKNPDIKGYGDLIELHILIDEMRRSGISVRETDDECEHYAVIDKKLVWHGGMNLLGKVDGYDNLIRIENEQAAAELLEMTERIIRRG